MAITIHHILSRIDSEQPTGATAVVQDNGTIVGALTLSLDEPGGYVRSLYVEEAYRYQGIGQLLLERAERICREQGRTALQLSVKDTNEGAQRLYTRLGFVPHAQVHEGYTQRIKLLS